MTTSTIQTSTQKATAMQRKMFTVNAAMANDLVDQTHVIASVDFIEEDKDCANAASGIIQQGGRLAKHSHDILLGGAAVHAERDKLHLQPAAKKAEEHRLAATTFAHQNNCVKENSL